MANTTDIYLIRHGIAADRAEYDFDEDRPLTNEGKQKTQKIAKRLKEDFKLHFDPILTSPLLRAQQTAEILQKAGLATQIEEYHHLAPAGDIKTWLDWLDKWQQTGGTTLALVGHEPNLGNWAEILVWGEPRGALVVKKAGVIGLSLPETGSPLGRCSLFLLAPPKFLLS
ncbi:MAG: phosphohistidine phosphatase SixA [Hormoscilla sp. GM7CHS1pb]|nr:phosphohistidine phosphatase SixA [Hormoscilla sp. GM7CHS1pb]